MIWIFIFLFSYYIEQTTGANGSVVPDVPNFSIESFDPENDGYGKAKITWKPVYDGNPGSHFYVQYRKKGEPKFLISEPETDNDTIIVGSLESHEEYEFQVVSVDGNLHTASASQFFDATGGGESDLG